MDNLDVVVLGTGLAESITAAALSKAGYSVAHIDINPYYGGDDASLTADELINWADERTSSGDHENSSYLTFQRKQFTSVSRSGTLPPQSRQFSISLAPTLIPSTGPLIDALIASGVSRYGGFKLLERVALFDSSGHVQPVPASKEDVFKNKQLSLVDKRRLMRLLMFAGGDFEGKPELTGNEDMPFVAFLHDKFSLKDDAAQAITYALAFCSRPSDPTLPALTRLRRYLRSTGRYGPSPFLVGHYGGAGEMAQGFCRTAAVGGATYVLGRQVKQLSRAATTGPSEREYTIELEDFSEPLRCNVLVTSSDDMPAAATSDFSTPDVARCIAVINTPIRFRTAASSAPEEPVTVSGEEVTPPSPAPDDQVDTALLVFPPGSIPDGSPDAAVNVLITGEGSMSAPRGQWILYITMPLLPGNDDNKSAEELLQPFLDATLSLTAPPSEDAETVRPSCVLFYKQCSAKTPAEPQDTQTTCIYRSPYSPYLPEIADSAAVNGEDMFWRAVKALKAAGRLPQGAAGEGSDVDSFWPPLDYVEEDGEEW
ncbi:hypothetical protein EIP86_001724 [Pleurotus ostreatoroseus]|nr:hypothetical protein EIP86_001724 [Pleurotus ostreatoroseus]